jgi:hypothetical protein
MTLTMNSHHFPTQHPPIGPSNGSTLLCVSNELHLAHIKDVCRLIFVLTGLLKSLCPAECSTFLGNVGIFNSTSRYHILEGSTFPNKYNLKNRKRKPVTCGVTKNGRFQEICTVSCLLIDEIHSVNPFTRTAAKLRPLDPRTLFETRRKNFTNTLI